MEVQKSQIHVDDEAELLTAGAAFHNPGRDFVQHVLGQTGDVVKKLVQAPMGEHQNPHRTLGGDGGVARVTRKDSQLSHDIASGNRGHMLPIPCHCGGSIEQDEHFKADLTLTSQNLPDRKDQLVSYLANFLQLPFGAVRKHWDRGEMPKVVVTNHPFHPFCRV